MGLLLSILVFSVGVIETIACFRHAQNAFISHHAHERTKPFPTNQNDNRNYLLKKSKVDICWPKDISSDSLHVITKRQRLESELSVEEGDETEEKQTVESAETSSKGDTVKVDLLIEKLKSIEVNHFVHSEISALSNQVILPVIDESDRSSAASEEISAKPWSRIDQTERNFTGNEGTSMNLSREIGNESSFGEKEIQTESALMSEGKGLDGSRFDPAGNSSDVSVGRVERQDGRGTGYDDDSGSYQSIAEEVEVPSENKAFWVRRKRM